jgi:hypothetical protein
LGIPLYLQFNTKQDSGAIILPVLMAECKTWSLTQRELKGMKEVTEGWRKCHNTEFHDLYSPSHQIKEDEVGRECSRHGTKLKQYSVLAG